MGGRVNIEKNRVLLDRADLRWLTLQMIIEVFDQSDFQIKASMPRIFNDRNREIYLPIIE